MKGKWNIAQDWESKWWNNCINTLNEEIKQRTYARLMGLQPIATESGYSYDLKEKHILDIGGGPVSLLLKCLNGYGCVMDPCDYPSWVEERYKAAGINYEKRKGEDLLDLLIDYPGEIKIDEIWLYNVLQHVDDPQKIIENIKKAGKMLRIFEWIDTIENIGHPHILTEEKLNNWIGQKGNIIVLNGENECYGKAYYGTFYLDI